MWVWEYETEEGAHDLYMDTGEEIRFRVVDESFVDTSPTGPRSAEVAAASEEPPKKEAPYSLVVRALDSECARRGSRFHEFALLEPRLYRLWAQVPTGHECLSFCRLEPLSDKWPSILETGGSLFPAGGQSPCEGDPSGAFWGDTRD